MSNRIFYQYIIVSSKPTTVIRMIKGGSSHQ